MNKMKKVMYSFFVIEFKSVGFIVMVLIKK